MSGPSCQTCIHLRPTEFACVPAKGVKPVWFPTWKNTDGKKQGTQPRFVAHTWDWWQAELCDAYEAKP